MAKQPRYYLDTNVVISIIEATGTFGHAQRRFVERIDASEIAAVTSELTLAECLIKAAGGQGSRGGRSIFEFSR